LAWFKKLGLINQAPTKNSRFLPLFNTFVGANGRSPLPFEPCQKINKNYLKTGGLKMQRTIFYSRIFLFASFVFIGFSCGGGEKEKSLKITSPENEAVIDESADLNSEASGIQIDVEAEVKGFELGDILYLWIEDDTGSWTSVNRVYDGSGKVVFSSVTFQPGTPEFPANYKLTVADSSRSIKSEEVLIHVTSCSQLAWIEPMNGFLWNAGDDKDNNIENGFQHDVKVTITSPPQTELSLYINNQISGTAVVREDQSAVFENVDFPSTHDIVLEIREGEKCKYSISGTLDIEAPECQIISPSGAEWLNLSNDEDAVSAGIQVDVIVSSQDAVSADLFIDDAQYGTSNFSGGRATFENATLSDAPAGGRCLRAVCTDDAGNKGFSGTTCYGVDSVVPQVTIEEPQDGAYLNDSADANPDEEGVQVAVVVSSDHPNTTVEMWVSSTAGDCSGIPTPGPDGTPRADENGRAEGQVTMPSMDGDVTICARITRQSGNLANDIVIVHFDTVAPNVQITRPNGNIPNYTENQPDDSLILLVEDETPGDERANFTVEAECELIGYEVKLYSTLSSTEKATSTCQACSSGCTLPGKAVFSGVYLEETAATPYSLYAAQTDDAGNTGISAQVPVVVDTIPPRPTIIDPSCGSTLNLPRNPTPPPDYLRSISFGFGGETPLAGSITLQILDSGGNVYSSYTESDIENYGTFARKVNAGFAEGENRIVACFDDEHGQNGCNSECRVTFQNRPTVIFTAPLDRANLGASNDTNPGTPGLQYEVKFNADVPNNSPTSLSINGTPEASRNCTFNPVTGKCEVTYPVTINEGRNIVLHGCATDSRGEGCKDITINVDLTPPSAITDLNLTIAQPRHRREGRITLSWTAPSDAGQPVSGYDIRCDSFQINDSNFNSATSYPYTGVVPNPGQPDRQEVVIPKVGLNTTYWCAVKALDIVNNPSNISNVPSIAITLLSQVIEGPSGTTDYFGYFADGLGDINGDGFEDFAVGSANNRVLIFFGVSNPSSVPTTPSVTINGPSGAQFGMAVAGIGNFNGDSFKDLAISAPLANSGKGEVYVFFGRNSWPATLNYTNANLTLTMDDPSSTMDDNARFGWSLSTAGDFNGDGLDDIIIGSYGWNANSGTAFVILGRNSFSTSVISVPNDLSTNFAGDFMINSPSGGSFGGSCSLIGRINADSFDDIACGANQTSSGGSVYLIYGRNSCPPNCGLNQISVNSTINSPDPVITEGLRFGNWISGSGDINGDGRDDLAVGAPWAPGDGTRQGKVYIFYHNGSTIDSTPDSIITNGSSAPASDQFGFMLARGKSGGFRNIGKIDNNFADLLIGSAAYGTGVGASFMFLGSTTFGASLTSENADYIFRYTGTETTVNSRPFYIGDVNNDGYSDFGIGFPQYASNRGEVVVYY